jgi:23S rRNA U2552 (ribose-2'-O)-methylase RlmE/FtsJ
MLKQVVKKIFAISGLEVHKAKDSVALWPRWLENAETGQFGHANNPLEEFFDSLNEGPGIWKWRHYFEIYHRHFSKFVGKDVHVLEIGVYSGGSLGMWKNYFGPKSTIYGVDIQPNCKTYENENEKVRIFIGDQADPHFWEAFRREVPQLDIVIDDGGHEPHQQIATMEALLPHLRPGGVFLCEDLSGEGNAFFDYVSRFAKHLNAYAWKLNLQDPEMRLSATPTPFQHAIHSVCLYPLVTVIERRGEPLNMVAPKHGTQWEPFLT